MARCGEAARVSRTRGTVFPPGRPIHPQPVLPDDVAFHRVGRGYQERVSRSGHEANGGVVHIVNTPTGDGDWSVFFQVNR